MRCFHQQEGTDLPCVWRTEQGRTQAIWLRNADIVGSRGGNHRRRSHGQEATDCTAATTQREPIGIGGSRIYMLPR